MAMSRDDFVILGEEIRDDSKDYEIILNRPAMRPFCVESSLGKVFYYLYRDIPDKKFEIMSSQIESLHKCRACVSNFKKMALLFGPDGYAIDFNLEYDSSIFRTIEGIRDSFSETFDNQKIFIVSKKNIENIPKYLGKPTPGSEMEKNLKRRADKHNKKITKDGVCRKEKMFIHLCLNIPKDFITKESVANTLSHSLLSKLRDGAMRSRMEQVITEFQEKGDGGMTFMEVLDETLMDPNLLRKEFWTRKHKMAVDVQNFAKQFDHGYCWMLMSAINKMHVKMYALCYGSSFSNGENLAFKELGQLMDVKKDVVDYSSIPSFMNSRSDPGSYMVRQVASAIESHSVISKFKVSLAWENPSDLDLWVRTGHGESIGYSNKKSRNGKVKLDFDANAGATVKNPVENITLDETSPGIYKIFVNNFSSRGSATIIPFTLVVNLNGEITTFESEWDRAKMKDNSRSDLIDMVHVTTVDITRDIINVANGKPKMSETEAKRYNAHEKDFGKIFGEIRTHVVNMVNEPTAVYFHHGVRPNKPTTRGMLSQMAFKSTTGCNVKTQSFYNSGSFFDTISNNGKISTIRVLAGEFPPSYVTSHSCSSALKNSLVVNTYFDKGRPARSPDPEEVSNNCRFDSSWGLSRLGKFQVNGIIPLNGYNFDGYLLSISGARMPDFSSDWIPSAGMYPTDLKNDYHKYRDIYQSHHTMIVPKTQHTGKEAIGVFLHKGKSYSLIFGGVEKKIMVN